MAGSEIDFALVVPDHINPDGIIVPLVGTRDKPLISLAGLCRGLGNEDVSQAVRRWVKKLGEENVVNIVRAANDIQTRGKPSTYKNYYVTEGNAYKVMLQSGAPNAEGFADWVCHEILPCIRKYGCYPAPTTEAVDSDVSRLASVLNQFAEMNSNILARLERVERLATDSRPAIAFPIFARQEQQHLIDPRQFIRAAWRNVDDRTIANIVRRMDSNYRSTLDRPAPQATPNCNARLMCEPEHMCFLLDAIQEYWKVHLRKLAQQAQQQDLFGLDDVG